MTPEENKQVAPTQNLEEAMSPAQEADPFDTPVDQTDTSFPLLNPGIKDLEVVKADKGLSKKDSNMLTFTLKTTADDIDTKGEKLQKGFPLYHRIVIDPSESRTANRICKDIALFAKACGVAGPTPRQIIDDPEILVGSVVRAKVIVTKATEEFPESNNIRSFITEDQKN